MEYFMFIQMRSKKWILHSKENIIMPWFVTTVTDPQSSSTCVFPPLLPINKQMRINLWTIYEGRKKVANDKIFLVVGLKMATGKRTLLFLAPRNHNKLSP